MSSKNGIVIPTLDEIIELNKKIEKTSTCNKDKLGSILAKVKAKRLSGDLKKDVASITVYYGMK